MVLNEYGQALRDAHAAYNEGINFYKIQEQKFLKLIRQAEDESAKQMYTKLANEVNLELQQTSIEEMLGTEKLNLFAEEVARLTHKIVGDDIQITNIVESSKGRTNITNKNYLKNYSTRLRDSINQYLILQGHHNEIINIYKNAFGRAGISDNATIEAIYGFVRRQLITEVLKVKHATQIKNNILLYTNNFKGDFREDFATSALNKYKNNIATRIGDKKNLQSKQTNMDILVGKNVNNLVSKELDNIVKNLDQLNNTLTIEQLLLEEQQYFTGQVKSWSMPDPSIPNSSDRTFRNIGTRTDLRNFFGFNSTQYGFDRGWHNSAKILGQNINKVLGSSNIFYVTGDRFIWTSQLIQTMKQASYFLTFYYSRKTNKNTRQYEFTYPTTGEVAWQKQMYKNMYKLKSNKL